MVLNFPHTAVFDRCGRILQFEDGTEIIVPERTFEGPVKILITKFRTKDEVHPITDALRFDPSIDLKKKKIYIKLPLIQEVVPGARIVLRDNPAYPDEDDCKPRPDIPVSVMPPMLAFIETPRMYTMQLIMQSD